MIELAIIPLNGNYDPLEGVSMLHMYIQPQFPDRIQKEALACNGVDEATLAVRGHSLEKSLILFDTWFDNLCAQTDCQCIQPLGHNYVFDRGFIEAFLGKLHYTHCFFHRFKDSMIAANFLNDRNMYNNDSKLFGSASLKAVSASLNIPYENAHTALADAAAAARVYRTLLTYKLGLI